MKDRAIIFLYFAYIGPYAIRYSSEQRKSNATKQLKHLSVSNDRLGFIASTCKLKFNQDEIRIAVL